jgi:U3 small nucleolar ribonucleoprotein protein LCP5
MKNYSLLSYLHCLLLLSSRRALGQSITSRSLPAQPFSTSDRSSRGSEPGDLVDSMIESRIVLEKIKTLETKLRYQIDKLVRLAEEPDNSSNVVDGMSLCPPWTVNKNYSYHRSVGIPSEPPKPYSDQ